MLSLHIYKQTGPVAHAAKNHAGTQISANSIDAIIDNHISPLILVFEMIAIEVKHKSCIKIPRPPGILLSM